MAVIAVSHRHRRLVIHVVVVALFVVIGGRRRHNQVGAFVQVSRPFSLGVLGDGDEQVRNGCSNSFVQDLLG